MSDLLHLANDLIADLSRLRKRCAELEAETARLNDELETERMHRLAALGLPARGSRTPHEAV